MIVIKWLVILITLIVLVILLYVTLSGNLSKNDKSEIIWVYPVLTINLLAMLVPLYRKEKGSLLSLYIRRKRLEEMYKIKEAEREIPPNDGEED